MRPARTCRSAVVVAGLVPLMLAAAIAGLALRGSPGTPGPRPAALPSVDGTGRALDQRGLLRTLTGLPGAGVGGGPAVPQNPVPPHFGTPDPTFGTKGTVTTAFPGRQVGASDLALLADQSMVAVGGALGNDSPDFAIARYRRDGALDPTFGTGGLVTTPWPAAQGASGAQGVAVGSGNRIVVIGTAGLGQGQDIGVAVARYLPSGAPDTTFGNGGKVISAVSPVGDGGGNAVAIQPDGKIVVVGGANDQAGEADFLAVRYLPDGNPDTSFGNNGVVLIPIPGGDSSAGAVALQANGAIVIAGTAIGPGSGGQEFGIARLTRTGALDTTFGSGGVVLAQFQPGQTKGGAQSVAVARDGRIMVAGLGQTPDGRGAFGLMRLAADGSLDPTFGTGGKVLTEFDGESIATRVVSLGSGGLVAVGSAGLPSRIALAGYRSDGSLDPAFGTHGRTVTAIGPASAGTSAVVQSSGNVVVGTSAAADFSTGGFALARYLGSAGCKPPVCTVGLG
jgi:uncharacterized delta-60 repeat protein